MTIIEAAQAIQDGKAEGTKRPHHKLVLTAGEVQSMMGGIVIGKALGYKGGIPAHFYLHDILADDWQLVDKL